MESDVRWEQRFSNFKKAFAKLKEAVNFDVDTDTSGDDITGEVLEMRRDSIIKRFELTHELAWNVMKDFAVFQGNSSITGSRDATRQAFQFGLIREGDVWMDMIKSRNLSVHNYDESKAEEISAKIQHAYYAAFAEFCDVMESRRNDEQKKLF